MNGATVASGGKPSNLFYEASSCFKPVAVHGVLQRRHAAVQAQQRRLDHRSMELFGWQGAGRHGAARLFMDGLAGGERPAGTRGGGAGLWRGAVQVQPGFFAGGKHGPVLSRLLQQDPLAAVPLFSRR